MKPFHNQHSPDEQSAGATNPASLSNVPPSLKRVTDSPATALADIARHWDCHSAQILLRTAYQILEDLNRHYSKHENIADPRFTPALNAVHLAWESVDFMDQYWGMLFAWESTSTHENCTPSEHNQNRKDA